MEFNLKSLTADVVAEKSKVSYKIIDIVRDEV